MNHIGTTPLTTERLLLRRFEACDAEPLWRNYGSDREVWRFVDFLPCSSPSECRRFIEEHLERYADDGFYGWCIEFEGSPIGTIGAFGYDAERGSIELGYSIGSRWWGKGLATEAVRAVIAFLFDIVGMRVLIARVDGRNLGSLRVLEKFGFQKAESSAVGGPSPLRAPCGDAGTILLELASGRVSGRGA